MPTDKLQILTPIVTSVNGQSGDVKSAWYFNFTSSDSTADKTPAEIYAAYQAGYSVYAIISDATPQLIFPCLNATESTLAFSGSGVMNNKLIVYTLIWDNTKWNLTWFDQEESLNQTYVSYQPQGLNDGLKQQARENIDAEQLYHGLTPSNYYVNDFYGTCTVYIAKGEINLPAAEITDTELLKALRRFYTWTTTSPLRADSAIQEGIGIARLINAGIITTPYVDYAYPYNSIKQRQIYSTTNTNNEIIVSFLCLNYDLSYEMSINANTLTVTNLYSFKSNVRTTINESTIKQYTLAANPTEDMQIATKKYVDDNATPQPDWNQHDSTQKDYIKNRIAYKDAIVTDETETLLISGTMGTNVSIESSQALQYGKTYHVTIGDDSFTTTPAHGDMGPCLTSGGAASDANYWAFITSGVTCSSSAGSDYTGKAYKIYEVVQQIEYDIKQLPEECLPDSTVTVNNINDIAVVHDCAQDLTDEQKAQARENIDAQELVRFPIQINNKTIYSDKFIDTTSFTSEQQTSLLNIANCVSTGLADSRIAEDKRKSASKGHYDLYKAGLLPSSIYLYYSSSINLPMYKYVSSVASAYYDTENKQVIQQENVTCTVQLVDGSNSCYFNWRWLSTDESVKTISEIKHPQIINGYLSQYEMAAVPTTDMEIATKKYVDDTTAAITVPTKTSDLTNDSKFIAFTELGDIDDIVVVESADEVNY